MTLRERVAWALAQSAIPDILQFPTDWGVMCRLNPSGAKRFLRMADAAIAEVDKYVTEPKHSGQHAPGTLDPVS